MAMFPDSGVPPADAKNSLPDVDTAGCDELWYSTSRCQPRFDPAAANAMLAELMNLVMEGEVRYGCSNLDNIEHSVRYLIQRGIMKCAVLSGGPNAYATTLDPTLTRYNNCLVLSAIPSANCGDGVSVNVDGLGAVPVLRNDGLPLVTNDWVNGIPYPICYWQGNFYMLCMVISQVPIPPPPFVDVWIRTDGNDSTGDGSENTPSKAFKTVGGAWNRVIDRFKQFPATLIIMKLGIPGTYEGGRLGPFGGDVILQGDQASPATYRVAAAPGAPPYQASLAIVGMTSMSLRGITVEQNTPSSQSAHGLRIINSIVYSQMLRLEAMLDHDGAPLLSVEQQGTFGISVLDVVFEGNGHQVRSAINVEGGGFVLGATGSFQFRNMTVAQATITANFLAGFAAKNAAVIGSNVTGPQYYITTNSVILMSGQPSVGSLPGVTATGGQFVP